MPTINQLSAVDSAQIGDLIPIFSQTNGDARKISVSALATFVQSQITQADNKQTQYAAPTATGFAVQVTGTSISVWLIVTPLAGYASGTITLPPVASALDKQELIVCCTQFVTALTVNGNGASVIGVPSSLTAGGFFTLRFDGVMDTWYRIG